FCMRRSADGDPVAFPTRRSSDLGATYLCNATFDYAGRRMRVEEMDCDDLRIAYAHAPVNRSRLVNRYTDWLTTRGMIEDQAGERSEEHTSVLQSRENLVCRLLRE